MATFTVDGEFGNIVWSPETLFRREDIKEEDPDYGKIPLIPRRVYDWVLEKKKEGKKEKVPDIEEPEKKKEGGSPFYRTLWNKDYPMYETEWTKDVEDDVVSYALRYALEDARYSGYKVKFIPFREMQKFNADYTLGGYLKGKNIYLVYGSPKKEQLINLVHEMSADEVWNENPDFTHKKLHPLIYKREGKKMDRYTSKALKDLKV